MSQMTEFAIDYDAMSNATTALPSEPATDVPDDVYMRLSPMQRRFDAAINYPPYSNLLREIYNSYGRLHPILHPKKRPAAAMPTKKKPASAATAGKKKPATAKRVRKQVKKKPAAKK